MNPNSHFQSRSSSHCFSYSRRQSRVIDVGGVKIGGGHSIKIQARTKYNPSDLDVCVEDVLDLVAKGCDIVRIPIHNVEQARQLEWISSELKQRGSHVPLAADLLCSQVAAFEALKWVQVARVDPSIYQHETDVTHADFLTLVHLCQELGKTILISGSHEHLTDELVEYYGSAALAMCEGVLLLAKIAREINFHNFAFSLNSTDPKVYIESNRLLVARLIQEGDDWNYPIHLSAIQMDPARGDSEIRTTIAMGCLLADGIGDTLRGDLSAKDDRRVQITESLMKNLQSSFVIHDFDETVAQVPQYDPYSYTRRPSSKLDVLLGGSHPVRIVSAEVSKTEGEDVILLEDLDVFSVNPCNSQEILELNAIGTPRLVTVAEVVTDVSPIYLFRMLAKNLASHHPILLKDTLRLPTGVKVDRKYVMKQAAFTIGSLLCDGIGDAILIQGDLQPEESVRLARKILKEVSCDK